MKNKNSLLIKWILAIVVLIVIVFRTQQVSTYMATLPSSNISSSYTLFEFMEMFFGIGHPGALFNARSKQTADQNPYVSILGKEGYGNGSNQGGLNSTGDNSLSESQGSNTYRKINGGSNNSANADNNLESTIGNAEGASAGSNQGTNEQNNEEINSENNAQYNSENPSENGSGNSSDNPSQNNSENNAQMNAQNNLNNNSGPTSGGNSGNGSGNNSGGSSTDNSGSGPSTATGNNYPTINPIPSDDTATQNIAKQNQQNITLATLLAARQALIAPIQEQAQTSKYQPVTSQSNPDTSTPMSPDTLAKIKSNKIIISHQTLPASK